MVHNLYFDENYLVNGEHIFFLGEQKLKDTFREFSILNYMYLVKEIKGIFRKKNFIIILAHVLHFLEKMIVYRLKFDTYNSERRKALIQEYFNGQPKKPPESVPVTKQEFEKATSVIYFPWKDKIDINVRENYWKQHHNFQPDIWQIIPLFRNTYSYMEFTYEEKLYWPDEIIDSIFQQRDFNEKPVCLLAATASGKTSAIFRTLSKQFGLFFCCDVNVSPVDCNLFTKDLLMRIFRDCVFDCSPEEIVGFGVNFGLLVFISLIFSLLMCHTENIQPHQFLKLQTNSSTDYSSMIFLGLVVNNYRHIEKNKLLSLLHKLLEELLTKLNIEQIRIFIDEAQLYFPNKIKLLGNRYTCTPYNSPRKNDLFSLIFAAFLEVKNKTRLIFTGTAFTANVFQQLNFGDGKQDIDYVHTIVGHSLINTKADLRDKLKSIMKITDELDKFIDRPSLDNYLPIRRRVFTLACANILEKNKNTKEAFTEAFDDSLD